MWWAISQQMVISRKSISISFFQFSVSAIIISATIIAARISTMHFLDLGPYYGYYVLFIEILTVMFLFEISCIVSHAKRIIATDKFFLWFLNPLIHQKFSFFEDFQVWIIVLLEKANDNNFLLILNKEFLLKDPYLERPYLTIEIFKKS